MRKEVHNCPICNSTNVQLINDRYGVLRCIHYYNYLCRDCKTQFHEAYNVKETFLGRKVKSSD